MSRTTRSRFPAYGKYRVPQTTSLEFHLTSMVHRFLSFLTFLLREFLRVHARGGCWPSWSRNNGNYHFILRIPTLSYAGYSVHIIKTRKGLSQGGEIALQTLRKRKWACVGVERVSVNFAVSLRGHLASAPSSRAFEGTKGSSIPSHQRESVKSL